MSLLVIITNLLLAIITSLLRDCYCIFTSLLLHDYKINKTKRQNSVIMSQLLHIFTLVVSIIIFYYLLLPIITYFYVFESDQVADDVEDEQGKHLIRIENRATFWRSCQLCKYEECSAQSD